MRHLLALVALAISGLAATTPTVAEPGPVVSRLMNENTSLFTFGMYLSRMNAERLAEGLGDKAGERLISAVSYHWDENRIKILLAVPIQPNASEVTAAQLEDRKNRCKDVLSEVRRRSHINPDTGDYHFIPGFGKTKTTFSQFFAQNWGIGAGRKTTPDDTFKKLDEIFYVVINISGTSCEGPLLSNKVLFNK